MYENYDSKPSWQHGALRRPEVSALLPKVEGAFLVRDGSKGSVLSVFSKGTIQHFVIKNVNGRFRIDDGPMYSTLVDLIDYYTNDPSSPTRLTTPVRRAVDPVAPSGGDAPSLLPRSGSTGKSRAPLPPLPADDVTDSAPPLLPRGGGAAITKIVDPSAAENNMYTNVETTPPTSSHTTSEDSTHSSASLTSSMPPTQPDPTPAATVPEPVLESIPRTDFKNLEVVKNVNEKKSSVAQIELEEQEVIEDDGAFESNRRRIQFEKEATASEKFNIFWLNQKLAKVGDGSDKVDNVKEALRNGVRIMQVLEVISGKKARYSKRPKLEVQFRDNWQSVVNFMRDLGIQVDTDGVKGSGDDETVDVSISAEKCGELDRRELLKLFTKIMLYENTVGR